ncbi:glycosyltransferase [Microbulbifer sp. VAAF005]|uniref:glycosyltransferase family 2 protein n=1 Tax=Microbulbifer sp. VAAF005 TaxID=3034230 RepID=UPI0024AD4554|nr:glycosyltransferase [Microbulbifer sp. VAAF005]WHI45305.1 glycosyltransferase [Microbulbifer sp. VAAF005]
MHPLLVICICTYQRPERLRNSLQSLAKLQLPSDLNVAALIVDNDSDAQAGRKVVDELSESFPFPLNCAVEEQRGIPCARNRCIDELNNMGADYLVFIDDDEWVEADWLIQLYDYSQKLGGNSVVCGSVIRRWPDSVPAYYSHIFYRQKRKTGEELNYCATSNVLIPMSSIRSLSLRFNEQDPLGAGTDVIFFTEYKAKGERFSTVWRLKYTKLYQRVGPICAGYRVGNSQLVLLWRSINLPKVAAIPVSLYLHWDSY